ncbi:MAG: polyamine aminopropyltransferase [Hydrococcus sp. C42_A2020_068]|uniref:polyamine aminopropyltransferase n=1 Tax=Pleurocapsa sp. PCC 7327 TaxID=118163 RepID=UPI00029FED60|nr:polyamine aminopropyltransferase [Pleurocapsa sp. PCC 7327]AFY77891.1 spermidine synthase [Pleurocapsa sp. PCC 7327]MBF2019274.1 polyamine aminopropyltransferase [Hydrococcus sp. C42_A2020_068]
MTNPDRPASELAFSQFNPSEWVIDGNESIALSIHIKGDRLFKEDSPYQTVEVFDTYGNGKMLTIDRMVMCTEADEASYHEMIAHVPMQTHPSVKDVLVIGAGDGGTIRELVRYPGIERVTMVEIDEAVVRASKQFLPTISSAFNHPKLNLLIDDGIKFVKEAADASYDLVIIDSSDPVGPSEGLFTKSFYEDVYRCLRTGGVVTVQSESPSYNPKAFIELNQCLKQVFGSDRVHCYLVFIPMYPTGMWSLTYCSKQGPHPIENFDYNKAKQFAKEHDLRYYNADIHKAAFCLPTYVQKMING